MAQPTEERRLTAEEPDVIVQRERVLTERQVEECLQAFGFIAGLAAGFSTVGDAVTVKGRDGQKRLRVDCEDSFSGLCRFIRSDPRRAGFCREVDDKMVRYAAKGKGGCFYACPFGLYDFVLPVSLGDRPIGVLISGQLKPKNYCEDLCTTAAIFPEKLDNVTVPLCIEDYSRKSRFQYEIGGSDDGEGRFKSRMAPIFDHATIFRALAGVEAFERALGELLHGQVIVEREVLRDALKYLEHPEEDRFWAARARAGTSLMLLAGSNAPSNHTPWPIVGMVRKGSGPPRDYQRHLTYYVTPQGVLFNGGGEASASAENDDPTGTPRIVTDPSKSRLWKSEDMCGSGPSGRDAALVEALIELNSPHILIGILSSSGVEADACCKLLQKCMESLGSWLQRMHDSICKNPAKPSVTPRQQAASLLSEAQKEIAKAASSLEPWGIVHNADYAIGSDVLGQEAFDRFVAGINAYLDEHVMDLLNGKLLQDRAANLLYHMFAHVASSVPLRGYSRERFAGFTSICRDLQNPGVDFENLPAKHPALFEKWHEI